MSTNFYMPNISLMGVDCLDELGKEIVSRDLKKALIVTGHIHTKLRLVKQVTDVLDKHGIKYVIFDETKPNPTVTNVNDGKKILEENNCDCIISYGGGSPHDAAKGMALLATNGGKIEDYEGIDKSKYPQLPLFAINTTAGTASEMTRFSIITDEKRHIKMAIVDKNITPLVAVNDAKLMITMPKALTAATGMDALTHAIEAYVSIAATPITDACAEKAIELIAKYLKIAVDNGEDLEARTQMAYAEYLAGMAFNNASLGYVHAMAHQLGGFYDLSHGVCNAILLPHVMKFNSDVCMERFKKIALLMGVNPHKLNKENVVDEAIGAVKKLSKEINIPAGIKELGAKEEDFKVLATNALKDACGLTNPKKATLEDIIEIYKSAM